MSSGKSTLTSRERVLRAIRRQETDRTPRDFKAEPPILDGLCRRFGFDDPESLRRKFGVDMERVWVEYKSPYADGRNLWGLKYEQVGPTRDVVFHPLAEAATVSDVDAYPWPDPACADIAKFKELAARSRATGRAVFGSSWGSIFGEPYRLMGMDHFMMALVERPEVAAAVINHVADFFVAVDKKAFEASRGMLDLSYHGNDFGSQRGLLMSRAMFLQFFAQPLKRLVAQAKGFGLLAMHHSCGAVSDIIPDLIACGVDVLDPVQVTAAGMNLKELRDRFGTKIAFHGGISAQRTLPLGSPAEVRAQVCEALEAMRPCGGYILAPDQSITEDTPLDNVIAMYEAADASDARA
jgi:uroporphyrinogen decarboxylase